MDNEMVAREILAVAKELQAASGGLWDYRNQMWAMVTKDLAKALSSAFGSYARPGFLMGKDGAYVVMEGYTKSDLTLKVTVHVWEKGNKYHLSVSAERPDWGKYATTVIDDEKPLSDFNVKEIAKRVAEGTL